MEQKVKMDQTVKIELTVNQINTVLAALAKQPLEVVLDTFIEIRTQAESQVKTEESIADNNQL